MSKSAWIHIIFGNACSTQGLWLEKIGGSEIFLILICYLGPLVHSGWEYNCEGSKAKRCYVWCNQLEKFEAAKATLVY